MVNGFLSLQTVLHRNGINLRFIGSAMAHFQKLGRIDVYSRLLIEVFLFLFTLFLSLVIFLICLGGRPIVQVGPVQSDALVPL